MDWNLLLGLPTLKNTNLERFTTTKLVVGNKNFPHCNCALKTFLVFRLHQKLYKLTSFNYSVPDLNKLCLEIENTQQAIVQLKAYKKPQTVADYYRNNLLTL